MRVAAKSLHPHSHLTIKYMKQILLTTALALATLSLSAKEFDYGYSALNPVGRSGLMCQRPVSLDATTVSTSQSLYTAEDLQGLNVIGEDGSVIKAAISEVSFVLMGNTENFSFKAPSLNVTLCVENTNATAFPVNSAEKPIFFEFSTDIIGEVYVSGSYSEEWRDFFFLGGYRSAENGLHATITLNKPIVYEGESLLFTWISENSDTDELFNGYGSYGIDPKNGIRTLFSRYGSLSEPDKEGGADTFLPALLLTYEEVRQESDGIIDGIEGILVDDGKAEYYNLQGVRVEGTLAPGIYIRREGGKAVKEFIFK